MEEKASCKKSSSLLIVEDDQSQLRTLTDIMQEEGFEVIGCSTASEALEHLDHLETGVVVLDQRLPDLSGTQLLERIAAAKDRIRVIINTAYSSYESAKDALNLGAFAYVEKMDNPEELLRQVHRAFEASLRSYADELETVVAERTQEMRRANELLRKEITEREREEQLLQKEKDKAQKYLDVAGVMLVAIDSEQRVGLINKKGCDILGYKEEEILAKNWFDNFLPERIRDEVKAVFEKNIQAETQAPECYENPILTKDGQERLISWHNTILRDKKGSVIATLSSGEDITERKKAEEALRESEEKYRVLFENAGEGIITLGLDGRITEANRLVEEYGFDRAELRGRKLFDFVPEYNKARSVSDFQALIAGRRVHGQMDVITPKGIISVEYRDTPIVRAGEVIGVQIIFTDITERKRAEEAHRSLVDHSLQGLAIFQNGRVVFANQPMADINGYTVEEMLAMSSEKVQEFVHPEDRELVWNRHQDRLKGKTVPERYEFRGIRKDGSTCWLELHASRIEYKAKPAIQAAYVDITERKKAEEVIEKLAKFPTEDPNPVLRISGHGTVLFANKASAILLKTWACRVGQSLPDRWNECVLDALSSGQSQQTEVQCDGRIFSLTFAPVVKANYVNVYGLDITERKKAEDQLSGALAWREAVFEGSRDAVFISDADSKFVTVNSSACKLTGYSREELLGMRIPDLHEEQDLTAYNLYHDRIMAGEEIVSEAKILRKDGTKVDTEFNNRCIKISGASYMHTVARDITERRKAQEKLIKNRAKLKVMASKILMAEEREKQNLAVGLHDEVCQKLVLTKLALESTLNLVSDSNVLASLRIACEGIGETIVKANSLTFELSNPVLRQLGFIIALEKYLTEEIQQKHGIEYELEGDEQLGTMQDEIKNCLFRVTRELLTNVVKHAQANKIKVSVSKGCGLINVSIKDDGVGFKESEDSEKVSQTTRFGLFSVREQLEYLGGHLEIESEPGRGTAATIVVPQTKKAIV
ncbi:MAG: PAS domain S-box protein [Phycisphaerae bacterium]